MKFSEFDEISWKANKIYYDTCLIPWTGLNGREAPPEIVARLERMRDRMDTLERLFRGRIVSYPVIQYGGSADVEVVNEICRNVKSNHFRYAIVLSAADLPMGQSIHESDLTLVQSDFEDGERIGYAAPVSVKIREMWEGQRL